MPKRGDCPFRGKAVLSGVYFPFSSFIQAEIYFTGWKIFVILNVNSIIIPL